MLLTIICSAYFVDLFRPAYAVAYFYYNRKLVSFLYTFSGSSLPQKLYRIWSDHIDIPRTDPKYNPITSWQKDHWSNNLWMRGGTLNNGEMGLYLTRRKNSTCHWWLGTWAYEPHPQFLCFSIYRGNKRSHICITYAGRSASKSHDVKDRKWRTSRNHGAPKILLEWAWEYMLNWDVAGLGVDIG